MPQLSLLPSPPVRTPRAAAPHVQAALRGTSLQPRRAESGAPRAPAAHLAAALAAGRTAAAAPLPAARWQGSAAPAAQPRLAGGPPARPPAAHVRTALAACAQPRAVVPARQPAPHVAAAVAAVGPRPPAAPAGVQLKPAAQAPPPFFGARPRVVQRMEHSGKSSVSTTAAWPTSSKEITLDLQNYNDMAILLGHAAEEQSTWTQREKFLAELRKAVGHSPLRILILSDSHQDVPDDDERNLRLVYQQHGTVTATNIDIQEGNDDRIHADNTGDFSSRLQDYDLILFRKGICYCDESDTNCGGLSRALNSDKAFLKQVAGALAAYPGALAYLGGAFDPDAAEVTNKRWRKSIKEMIESENLSFSIAPIGEEEKLYGMKLTRTDTLQ